MHYQYGIFKILGLVAFICGCYNATLHTIPYDAKKEAQPGGTETQNQKNRIEKIPENEVLRASLLRNPRCPDVSVIYLKIQDGW